RRRDQRDQIKRERVSPKFDVMKEFKCDGLYCRGAHITSQAAARGSFGSVRCSLAEWRRCHRAWRRRPLLALLGLLVLSVVAKGSHPAGLRAGFGKIHLLGSS